MTLFINLATRARPQLVVETLQKTLPNIVLRDTKILVSLDSDDNESVQAVSQMALDDRRLVLSLKDREDSLGEKYNRVLEYEADAYMAMVDYAPLVTHGFDEKIMEAATIFPDGIGVVYNHLANASFPEINVVTAALAKKMGFFYPPWFPYWFVDHWLDDIARMINRIAFADVKIDRLKRPGTQDLRDLSFWTILFDALALRRRKMARAIIDSDDFLDPEWRKELSRRHHPLIEVRSKWINDGMRADPKAIEATGSKGIPDDERYTRVKRKALELMAELIPELQAEEAA